MSNFKIKKSHLIFLYIAACLIKIITSYFQFPVVAAGYAPIDDDLMFEAAVSITNGNWLGDYSSVSLSKHMFFSLWLSFINFLNIPYLVANCLLWIAAAFYGIFSFKPVIKNDVSLWFLFCGILYNPSISAQFSLRVYRDSFFPIITMFFFFSIIAIGLRYKENFKKFIPHFIILGISFGISYLTREDGYWALPFLLVAFSVLIYKWFKNKDKEKLLKTFGILISATISMTLILSYSYMNYLHYDRFIVSDFTSDDFTSAYGALASVESDTFHPMVTVSEDMRDKISEEVPSFSLISHHFKETPSITYGFLDGTIGDYKAGSFYWALRVALELDGYYETPLKAQEYYETLTKEVQLAVDEGRLTTYNGSTNLRTSLTPRITPYYIFPTLEETVNGFSAALFFKQCTPISLAALGDADDLDKISEYINQEISSVATENSELVHLDLKRIPIHLFLEFMNSIYTFFVPLMFIITIFWQIKQLNTVLFDKKENIDNILNLILIGIIGMAILRCAMIAFMEVSAFGIGTYGMYLSTVYPLIVVYTFIGFIKTFEN